MDELLRELLLKAVLGTTSDHVRGCRVVRGPDWRYDNVDGGEGHVGTVETEGKNVVQVTWDNGKSGIYRIGKDNAYDLRVVDSAPAGVVHNSVTCNTCNEDPLSGTRWKCAICKDLDLCTRCYLSDRHDKQHKFSRFDTASCKGHQLGPREGQTYIPLRGIFPGARVKRGTDWKWNEQDGGNGKIGTVQQIKDWEEVEHSGIVVLWDESRVRAKYRLGSQGMVDLECVSPARDGSYYPQHLMVFGKEDSCKGLDGK